MERFRKLGFKNEKYVFLNLNLNGLVSINVLKKLNREVINIPIFSTIKLVSLFAGKYKHFLRYLKNLRPVNCFFLKKKLISGNL